MNTQLLKALFVRGVLVHRVVALRRDRVRNASRRCTLFDPGAEMLHTLRASVRPCVFVVAGGGTRGGDALLCHRDSLRLGWAGDGNWKPQSSAGASLSGLWAHGMLAI